jgi:hypothetical protein
VTDHQNAFPFVGEYVWHTGNKCSAILISPAWALTANHCVTGSLTEESSCVLAAGHPTSKAQDDLTISFANTGVAAAGSGSPAVTSHTFSVSGSVKVRVSSPIDQCSDDTVAKDLALILLDERIPMSVVSPLHVPGVGLTTGPTCKNAGSTFDFGATLVGFGGSSDWRTYLHSSGWKRQSQSAGAIYHNAWFLDGSYPGASEPGDSGGALLRGNVLCGVTSGHIPGIEVRGSWPFKYVVPVMYTNTAAVDSPEAISFITEPVVDDDGRLMGECLPNEGPAHLRDVDSDGDLLPDACDPCPNFADPKYRETGAVTVYTDPRTGEKFGPGCCPASYRNLPGYTPALEQAPSLPPASTAPSKPPRCSM